MGLAAAALLRVGGKTQTVNLREGRRLQKLRREVAAYQRFRQTCAQLIEVNEALCALRPEPDADDVARSGLKKKERSKRFQLGQPTYSVKRVGSGK